MTVLFSELLVPGWAQDGQMSGLGDVTGAYGSEIAFTLPCHNADPEIFFSDKAEIINGAKALCGGCPVRSQCLDAALSRNEPCGVWGWRTLRRWIRHCAQANCWSPTFRTERRGLIVGGHGVGGHDVR